MMTLLSNYFKKEIVVHDNSFDRLGYVDSPFDGTLVFCDGIKYINAAINNPAVSSIITTKELSGLVNRNSGLVIAEDPRNVFYQLHRQWLNEGRYQSPFQPFRGDNCRIHSSAIVDPECFLGDNVTISEQVVIRGCVRILSGVTIEPGVKVGVNGILYDFGETGPTIIPHGGSVEVGKDTALMTNSVVVRSIHDTDVTRVGSNCVIGLGATVGHEAKVGNGVVVSNHCVVARRCQVGDGAFLGTGAFIREHVKIGSGAKIMSGSIVIDDVSKEETVSGNFAEPHQQRLFDFAKRKHKQRR